MHEAGQLASRLIATFPGVAARREDLAALVARHPQAEGSAFVDDVMLAWAAGLGDGAAQTRLDDGAFAAAGHHLRARAFAEWIVTEAVQLTRVSLLVCASGLPAICTYSGRGPLAAFVRVATFRNALRTLPDRDRHINIDHQVLAAPASEEPELASLRQRYGAEVRDAVVAAWARLPKHDRFVLSLQLHGKLSLPEISTLYGIHRVSAARKVASARTALLDATRAHLRGALGAADATVDSVLRLVSLPMSVGDLAPATGVRAPG